MPRRLRIESLEGRRLLAAGGPPGATETDTGEFLLGRVAVTPVFFESNGAIDEESQDWSAAEIDQILAKITDGVQWWADALEELDTVHELEFVFDTQYAVEPFETSYEPIDRPSDDIDEPIKEFLTPFGLGDSRSLEHAIHRFNDAQRATLDTDWSFTIFIADSSDDPDGAFASGGPFSTAFAYAGGLYFVMPSTRPTSTVTHEMGHIFWARDEYPGGGSWTDHRGYYNTQNWNAADNPTPGFVQEDSIMRSGDPLLRSFATHTSPESTLAMVGWQDSDGDGIFDVADVPLDLDAVGYFDPLTSVYHLRGSASAIPLPNRNSSGNQSDITLNQISRVEYSLDGGDWQTAAEYDSPKAEIDLQFPIATLFDSIRFRAIDANVGVTSPVVEGTATAAAISASSVRGGLYFDDDSSGERSLDESVLSSATVTIQTLAGTPLPQGTARASELNEGEVTAPIDGIELSTAGIAFGTNPGVFETSIGSSLEVDLFHAYRVQSDRWIAEWSSRNALQADFPSTTGDVTVELVGLKDEISYGRIEAYDQNGQLLSRGTSSGILQGQSLELSIHDPSGRIATVRVFGHASTEIGIAAIRFGIDSSQVTAEDGTFRFANLPDGQYRVNVEAENTIHGFDEDGYTIDVSGGVSPSSLLGAQRVDSPWHNVANPADVNEQDGITALDALLVINDLNRDGPRLLERGSQVGLLYDVNNDGFVTAADALRVINSLNRDAEAEGEGPAQASSTFTVTATVMAVSPTVQLAGSGDVSDELKGEQGGRQPDKSAVRFSSDPVTDDLTPASDLSIDTVPRVPLAANEELSGVTDGVREEFFADLGRESVNRLPHS